MDNRRLEWMYCCWSSETNDPESLDWRYELTEEESEIVDDWDCQFNGGIIRLCEDILELGGKRSAI